MLEEEVDVARVVTGVNEEAGLLWRPLALVRIVDVAARTRKGFAVTLTFKTCNYLTFVATIFSCSKHNIKAYVRGSQTFSMATPKIDLKNLPTLKKSCDP